MTEKIEQLEAGLASDLNRELDTEYANVDGLGGYATVKINKKAVILNGIRLSFDDAIEKLDLITKQVEQHYTYWLMRKNKLNEHHVIHFDLIFGRFHALRHELFDKRKRLELGI